MKILLAGISAKFIHSCLAVHLLSKYAREQYGISSQTAEFTINQPEDLILSELYRAAPDLLGFSCYIWNYERIRRLIRSIKKVLPDTLIFVGGPEVSFDTPKVLMETEADFVLSGEGEEPFSRLCMALENGTSLAEVPSLTWREGEQIQVNPMAKPLDLGKLPFVYEDFSQFENRIIYYEAQRGCPFNCQYCLSSVDKGVRFQPLDKVKTELKRFLDAKIPQVKFVDRTFNTNAKFAMDIWRFLAENDNGVTNFHFEMESDLFTEEQLEFLSTVRPGLFQFEIGVQSANSETLKAVDRRTDFDKLTKVVNWLKKGQNIHLHLDLIAGLPFEDYESFGHSFDVVYKLKPDQLQLGFLKLLKGSGLRRDAEKYGIVCRDEAPYEVLCTRELPFSDLLRLKEIEEQVELYYNSGRFRAALQYLVPLAESPFRFFEKLANLRREKGLHLAPRSLLEQYEILYCCGLSLPGCDAESLGFRIRYDLYSHEKAKKLPDWLPVLDSPQLRQMRRDFFQNPENIREFLPEYQGLDPKQVEKMAHLDFFPFHPLTQGGACACLFNYRRTDLLGQAAAVFFSRDERTVHFLK